MPIINLVYEGHTIPLKSYEEITAMSVNNAVTELNTAPTDYLDKFNSEGHLYIVEGEYWLSSNGDIDGCWYSDGYYVRYRQNTWEKTDSIPPISFD